jgi:hypothetical protein
LFAETISQFEFSALSLVAEPFWMTSQGQVLPSMEKILMYDDYGATTYIELCAFSILYRSTKIDSNWLKHPVEFGGGIHMFGIFVHPWIKVIF